MHFSEGQYVFQSLDATKIILMISYFYFIDFIYKTIGDSNLIVFAIVYHSHQILCEPLRFFIQINRKEMPSAVKKKKQQQNKIKK